MAGKQLPEHKNIAHALARGHLPPEYHFYSHSADRAAATPNAWEADRENSNKYLGWNPKTGRLEIMER